MLISKKQREAVMKAMACRMPFALFALPDGKCMFIANPTKPNAESINDARIDDSDWDGFFINFFGNDEPYIKGVAHVCNEWTIEKYISQHRLADATWPLPEIKPVMESTDRMKYVASARRIIASLKKTRGKTVFSRLIAETSRIHPVDVAERYFQAMPSTFRYLYFTQETGLWIGASPEILLMVNTTSRRFLTMALAGTLPIASDAQWDSKNHREHQYVVKHMREALTETKTKFIEEPTSELQCGVVRHLQTRFRGTLETDCWKQFLYTLSPTPAINGYPSTDARIDIFSNETHDRYCYGGFVGVRHADMLVSFVNLRCAFIDVNPSCGWIYNLYVGGGLTPDSNAPDEWEETELKARVLLDIIRSDKL